MESWKAEWCNCKERWWLDRLLRSICFALCLWAAVVPSVQAVKLAELDGLSYSSDEYLAALESLPADYYRGVLASENEARNLLKTAMMDKHLAQQARQQGLDTLVIVKKFWLYSVRRC